MYNRITPVCQVRKYVLGPRVDKNLLFENKKVGFYGF